MDTEISASLQEDIIRKPLSDKRQAFVVVVNDGKTNIALTQLTDLTSSDLADISSCTLPPSPNFKFISELNIPEQAAEEQSPLNHLIGNNGLLLELKKYLAEKGFKQLDLYFPEIPDEIAEDERKSYDPTIFGDAKESRNEYIAIPQRTSDDRGTMNLSGVVKSNKSNLRIGFEFSTQRSRRI